MLCDNRSELYIARVFDVVPLLFIGLSDEFIKHYIIRYSNYQIESTPT